MPKLETCETCGGTGQGPCGSCGDGQEECCCDDNVETDCDACEGTGDIEQDDEEEEEDLKLNGAKMTKARLKEVVTQATALQRQGRYIDSIRLFRSATGSGLKEAKDAADILRRVTCRD